METIIKRLEQQGYGKQHPNYEILVELLTIVKGLKDTIEPFISNDPIKHRFNLKIRGRLYPFMATQDEEYFLRKAAKLMSNQ